MHHTIHTFAFHTRMRMLLVPKCALRYRLNEKKINNNNKNKYLKISVIHAMDVICRHHESCFASSLILLF